MAIHYRTQGFILKERDFSEADRFFTVFTKDFGRLEILARALRKIKSKLRSGVQLFWLSEIEFIQGKNFKTLTDAFSVKSFKTIRGDLKRLKIAFQIADLFDKAVKAPEKDERLWQLLKEVFYTLNNCSLFTPYNSKSPGLNTWDEGNFKYDKENPGPSGRGYTGFTIRCSLLYYYFFWNLFSILGYSPNLYHCSLCQERLKPNFLHFSQREGGVICKNCFKKINPEQRLKTQEIPLETVKILRIILNRDFKTLMRLKIQFLHLESLKNISESYFLDNYGQKYYEE